jgi:hypothetical protein
MRLGGTNNERYCTSESRPVGPAVGRSRERHKTEVSSLFPQGISMGRIRREIVCAPSPCKAAAWAAALGLPALLARPGYPGLCRELVLHIISGTVVKVSIDS